MLRYRRRDGSFSAHGDGDPAGSLWLTVLTMRTFTDASKLIPSGKRTERWSYNWHVTLYSC